MRLTRLLAEDGPFLELACRSFLHEHLRWWSEAYALGWSEADIDRHLTEQGLLARDCRRLAEASRQFETNFVAVARDGERPVGAIWAESHTHPFLAFEVGVIAWIYVDPEVRGAGVGGRLVESALGWMRSRGLTCVELFVVANNVPAVRMYEGAGLRVIDHRMGGPL